MFTISVNFTDITKLHNFSKNDIKKVLLGSFPRLLGFAVGEKSVSRSQAGRELIAIYKWCEVSRS